MSLPYTTSTSNILPRLSTRGAFSAWQMAEVSIVADMTTIFRSGRMVRCVSRTRAKAASVMMLRS